MKRLLSHLSKDERGATMVEFALLVPVIFGTFLGVLQVGIGMQAYNALRNVSADASRFAMVEYQRDATLTTTQIEDEAADLATSSTYLLDGDRFEADVTQQGTSRVDGAIEYEIEVTYSIPTVLAVLGIDDIPISFTRPIFVIDPAA